MNKYIPLIMVVTFWTLFYVGNKYPETGDVIAIISVFLFVMLILFGAKSYLKKTIMNK